MSTQELEHELEISNRVFEAGELQHALEHLARAFALAPSDEKVQACFEAIAQRTDVLAVVPDEPNLGTKLLRAYALRRASRIDEAVVQLAMIVEQFPAKGLEVILASWLVVGRAQGRTLGKNATNQLTRLLAVVGESTIGLHRLRAGERALLAGYGELARAYLDFAPGEVGVSAAVGMLRRVGRCEEALVEIEDASHSFALVQKGLTLRAMGAGAAAAVAFEAAASLNAGDTDFVVEQARCWFVAGDLARASALLESIPPSENEEVQRLAQACATPRGWGTPEERVAVLDDIRRARVSPPMDAPSDATANIFRINAKEIPLGSGGMSVAISGWESPSNRLLLALHSMLTTDVTKVEYSIAGADLPFDPLSQRRGSATPLWVDRAGVVVQGPPEPPAELRRAIAAVAQAADGIGELWDRAERLASTLGPSRSDAIAAALVHPPTDREWLESLPDGLFRYQIATAFVLAALPNAWSTTRPIFESILFGPVD